MLRGEGGSENNVHLTLYVEKSICDFSLRPGPGNFDCNVVMMLRKALLYRQLSREQITGH